MRSRLPSGYRSVIVCDTRRAEEWRAGLRRRGFDVAVVETAADNSKGGWEVGVSDAHAVAARAYVSDVMQGRARLSRRPSWKGVLVVAVIVMLLVVWLARAA